MIGLINADDVTYILVSTYGKKGKRFHLVEFDGIKFMYSYQTRNVLYDFNTTTKMALKSFRVSRDSLFIVYKSESSEEHLNSEFTIVEIDRESGSITR